MNTKLLLIKNKARLERMIENDECYEKILKQSQLLYKYILMQFLMQRQEKVIKNEVKRRKLKNTKSLKTVENTKL